MSTEPAVLCTERCFSSPTAAARAVGGTVFEVATLSEAAGLLARPGLEALVVRCGSVAAAHAFEHWPALAQAVQELAVVVLLAQDDLDWAQRLVQRGVQEVLVDTRPAVPDAATSAAHDAQLARSVRLARVRKQQELLLRKGGSIDLATGLPSAEQWMGHLTQLCALRERESAPMAVLVLRIEGLASVAARLGATTAQVLRRKVAVRLRSALRASDLVGTLGQDSYAVLLPWMLAPQDSQLVQAKLLKALHRPFSVAGENLVVAVAHGLANYPDQARDAQALLRLAQGEAAQRPAHGRSGHANPAEASAQGLAGLGKGGAANDDNVS
jgi:diguanylate cyclase (GGDEF)-like protein